MSFYNSFRLSKQIRKNNMYISIEKNKVNGSLILTGEKNGYFVSRVYYYYTTAQAKKLFKEELKTIN
jgi:hypothetical protein